MTLLFRKLISLLYYMTKQKWLSLSTQLLYKALPTKTGIRWQPHGLLKPSSSTKNSSKDEQIIYIISFEASWKHAWTLVYFFAEARPCIFGKFVAFHPNNLVHLHLCQCSQGDQVSTICRIQLRPSDIVVSPDIEVALIINGFLTGLV